MLNSPTGHPCEALPSATVLRPRGALVGLAPGRLAAAPTAAPLIGQWRPTGWRGWSLTGDSQLVDPDHLLTSPPIPLTPATAGGPRAND